ncbi:hypothetical protein PENSPDRAFT_674774 [Peniophora sp. CONT]|nr:hypothetical protein PENSPDRAFT_674774 [Peniophora sp. CONT]
MDVPDAPPVCFTLRPHHLHLLVMITLLFKHFPRLRFHPQFLARMHEIIIRELSETSAPMVYGEIMGEIEWAPEADNQGALDFLEALQPKHQDFGSHRRSYYGYFCRRSLVAFKKLSFAGTARLREDHSAWLQGHNDAGYHKVEVDPMSIGDVLWKTTSDEYEWALSGSYSQFERAVAVNDSNLGHESLRQFFEQHFHDGSDSGLRQHALLNLSRMHYIRNEYSAARKFLTEAIDVSRTSGDKVTLQHCQSLMRRMPRHWVEKPPVNEIQPALHPLEVLFDVEKLIHGLSEQPLSAAFEKLTQAIGLYDHWIDSQGQIPHDKEEWSHHAVQSILWQEAGCSRLAAIEENIVTLFSPGGDDNNAIVVTLNRAYRRARQGEYRGALADLLSPSVWRGLTLTDIGRWTWQIWQILATRASRRGQIRLWHDFLLPRRPAGPYDARDYFFKNPKPVKSSGALIRDPLIDTMELRETDQSAYTIERLLTALWHAEYQFRFNYYRTGMIMLADIGLEFGMTKRSQEIVESILPQVIAGDDLEQRALACFTYARCTLAAAERSVESMRAAISFLEQAEKDYTKIECLRSLTDVQYLLSVLHHNLGQEPERDAAAVRTLKTEELAASEAALESEQWVEDVWRLVTDIGAKMAMR